MKTQKTKNQDLLQSLVVGQAPDAFGATLIRELQFGDLILPEGTRVAIMELPEHYETSMDGDTRLCEPDSFLGTPDGELWVDIFRGDFVRDC